VIQCLDTHRFDPCSDGTSPLLLVLQGRCNEKQTALVCKAGTSSHDHALQSDSYLGSGPFLVSSPP
jgi:hypothetical protein